MSRFPAVPRALFVAGCISTLLSACSDTSTCDGSPMEPQLLVIDAATDEPVCDAELVAVSSDGTRSQLNATGAPDPCEGTFAFAAGSGQFTVTVTAPGYQSRDVSVRAQQTECSLRVSSGDGATSQRAGALAIGLAAE